MASIGHAKLSDVAQKAGVSAAIASRVLNSDPNVRVREATRQRIQETAASMGYVPHSVAQSLRGGRTGAIGLVMHGLDSPINVDVLAGARRYCGDRGYVTLLAEAEELAESHSRLSAFVARGRLDGVILHSGYGQEDNLLDAISCSVPAVLINADDGRDAPSVQIDDAAAGALATNHLLDSGHQDIAFVAGSQNSQTSDRREAGYRSAMMGKGTTEVLYAGWSAASGAEAIQKLVGRPRQPTGIVVANAVTAAGVLSFLRDRKIIVPDHISVIAIHDSWFLPHLSVALSAVRLPLRDQGIAAAKLLIDNLDGHGTSENLFITDPAPELILRDSTAPPLFLDI